MFGIGHLELLVIAAILFLLVAVPVIGLVVVLVVVNRHKPPKDEVRKGESLEE